MNVNKIVLWRVVSRKEREPVALHLPAQPSSSRLLYINLVAVVVFVSLTLPIASINHRQSPARQHIRSRVFQVSAVRCVRKVMVPSTYIILYVLT